MYLILLTAGGLRGLPIKTLAPDVGVLIISGQRNHITISPTFSQLKKLQILRIVDSNVQSLGKYSFWGIQTLRVLGTRGGDYCNYQFYQ